MPIPPYDALMLPVLKHAAEKPWLMRDLVNRIADDLGLSPAERQQLIPSGSVPLIDNRVQWAKTYLKQAGLVEQPKRAVVQASERGREVLRSNPAKIDPAFLQQFEEFRAFITRTKIAQPAAPSNGPTQSIIVDVPPSSETPELQIAAASKALEESLRDALLARLLEASPAFFERAIIDLLLAMGYGGSRVDAGEQLGGTADGGVDGVIREDQLGLDRVYLQAKRYKPGNNVGSETVQAFIGALVGRGANKGVLITTSSFTKAAIAASNQVGSLRLVLIDGAELTDLMIRFNVGVRVAQTIAIKKVDVDYFEETEAE